MKYLFLIQWEVSKQAEFPEIWNKFVSILFDIHGFEVHRSILFNRYVLYRDGLNTHLRKMLTKPGLSANGRKVLEIAIAGLEYNQVIDTWYDRLRYRYVQGFLLGGPSLNLMSKDGYDTIMNSFPQNFEFKRIMINPVENTHYSDEDSICTYLKNKEDGMQTLLRQIKDAKNAYPYKPDNVYQEYINLLRRLPSEDDDESVYSE